MKKRILFLASLIFVISLLRAQNKQDNLKLGNLGELVTPVKNDTIPIEIWNDYILVKVKVNGIENDFLWDNGFSFSALDKSMVSAYNLKPQPETDPLTITDGVNGKVNLDLKIADIMSFGKTSVKNSPLLATDMTAFFGQDSKVKGILGATAIKKVNWKFNFDDNYVVVSEKPFLDNGKTLPFRLDPYNKMTIELEVNGYKDFAEVDFGSNSEDLGIPIEGKSLFEKNPKSPSYGIGSASVSGFAAADTIYAVKGFTYSLHDGQKFDFPFNIELSASYRDARFGNRFFRKYNTIFNFSNSEIILLQREKPINPFPTKSYGFVFIKDGDQLKLILKSKNRNTEKYQELKLNDVIKAIDGKNANSFAGNFDLRAYQLNKLNNNQDLTITTTSGKVIILKPVENIFE